MIELLVMLFYGYVRAGVVFGVYFIGWGAARIDHEAKDMSLAVRLLLLPGSVALWPLLLQKLLRHRSSSPTDSNPV
ncbi:hypothetical protein [Spirosoma aerolatum]|uniref:hypothetical protein n=1 Tax=Spirosoma aerolatum TaxID=1211326 RepID=UPI0009ADA3DD|nr:hypothetical protein [Spirosoma aerolatum]